MTLPDPTYWRCPLWCAATDHGRRTSRAASEPLHSRTVGALEGWPVSVAVQARGYDPPALVVNCPTGLAVEQARLLGLWLADGANLLADIEAAAEHLADA